MYGSRVWFTLCYFPLDFICLFLFYNPGIAAVVSLFSLCWAMVAYSKNHRKVRNDKNIMSVPGLILQTIWRIGMISSRVVALVLFATFFKAYLFVVAGKLMEHLILIIPCNGKLFFP